MKAISKQVIEISIGGYHMTMDAEKMSIIDGLSNGNSREFRQIQEMTDWLLDLCCDCSPSDEDCLKYLKYLKNLRGAFEYLRSLGVTKEEGGTV